MKILEINKFYNSKRGADKHFLELIALLKENGHNVADFAMEQKDDEKSEWSRYFLTTVGYTGKFSLWQQLKGIGRMFYSLEAKKKINLILDEFAPDVVHIHNIYHQMSPTILFEIKKRNIPIVMTVHDWKLINPNHAMTLNGKPYSGCLNGRYYQCFLDKCIKDSYLKSLLATSEMYWHKWLGTYSKNIDLYLAPSEFVRKRLIEWGIPAQKIVLLPHFFKQGKEGGNETANEKVAEKYAIYAGSVSRDKGADLLIETFKEVSGMKLYLAGVMEDGMEEMLHDNVKYLGFVKTDQLNNLIKESSCVVSGSKLPETFGLVALEAISQDKPFIGFDSGAYGEIIENGKNGFLAATDDEFKSVLNSVAQGKISFSKDQIREIAKRYGAGIYLREIIAVFNQVISDKKMLDKR